MASLAGLKAEVQRLRAKASARVNHTGRVVLERLRADPTLPFKALGWDPDPWQTRFLKCQAKRESLLCSRQAGKSTVTAARVIREALLFPRADCLVFCPTMRQSMEMLRKVREFYRALGSPVAEVADTKTSLELANGSRVISLPDSQEGVVGFSAPRLVVIDEGSRVSDEREVDVRIDVGERDRAIGLHAEDRMFATLDIRFDVADRVRTRPVGRLDELAALRSRIVFAPLEDARNLRCSGRRAGDVASRQTDDGIALVDGRGVSLRDLARVDLERRCCSGAASPDAAEAEGGERIRHIGSPDCVVAWASASAAEIGGTTRSQRVTHRVKRGARARPAMA